MFNDKPATLDEVNKVTKKEHQSEGGGQFSLCQRLCYHRFCLKAKQVSRAHDSGIDLTNVSSACWDWTGRHFASHRTDGTCWCGSPERSARAAEARKARRLATWVSEVMVKPDPALGLTTAL
ncbi:hypothetical protein ACOMHN_018462 [Nucella lapillus]